jgi:hypothetical protein
MSIESARTIRAHAKQQSHKTKKVRGKKLAPLPIPESLKLSDDRCMTVLEWAAVCGISSRTARRILAGPDGPEIVWLSKRRIGITVKANREWQQSRARPPGEGTR